MKERNGCGMICFVIALVVGLVWGGIAFWNSDYRKEWTFRNQQEQEQREMLAAIQAAQERDARAEAEKRARELTLERERKERRERERLARLEGIRTPVRTYFSELTKVDEFFILHPEIVELRNLKLSFSEKVRKCREQQSRLREALIGQDSEKNERYQRLRKRTSFYVYLYVEAVSQMRDAYLDYLSEAPLADIAQKVSSACRRLSQEREAESIPDLYSFENQKKAFEQSKFSDLYDIDFLLEYANTQKESQKILRCYSRVALQEVLAQVVRDSDSSEECREIALWCITEKAILEQLLNEASDRREVKISVAARMREVSENSK